MTLPTSFSLGYQTEAQLRAVPEMAASGYINRAGIPDTRVDCNTRANAVYAEFMREMLVQINNMANGTLIVPGISNVTGKSWRDGDDGCNTVVETDFAAYGIEFPTNLWTFNQSIGATLGSVAMLSSNGSFPSWGVINARGGVNGESRFIHGARSFYNLHYLSAAVIPSMAAITTVAGFFRLSHWNQTNDGIVLLAYRRYDGNSEVSGAYRLGFELGLGRTSGTSTPEELALYYRHVDATDVERIHFIKPSTDRVSLSFGQEVFLAFRRNATSIDFFVNGLLFASSTFTAGQGPATGGSPSMRLLVGGDWDSTRYNNGSCRNLAVWTGTQPTDAMLLNYYRVGAGFSPKGPPV